MREGDKRERKEEEIKGYKRRRCKDERQGTARAEAKAEIKIEKAKATRALLAA